MSNWANVADVRKVCQVSTSDFTDPQIESFISLAQREINSKIISKVIRERVFFIDNYRSNNVDGSNKTFFIRNWKGNFIADYNYDNSVDINDVLVNIYDANTEVETTVVPASIDIDSCSFTLTSTPTNSQYVFVSYAYSPLDPITPDYFTKQCVSYLAGAYLFTGNDGFKIKFGNVSVEPGASGGKGKQLYDKYKELLTQLIVNANGGAIVGDMATKI